MTNNNTVSIVIGSWGSYNECNERALGSRRFDLSEFETWDDIEAELEKQGFELDGLDEELFIQDIDDFPGEISGDYTHPKTFFEVLKESGVLDDEYKYKIMVAFIEVLSYFDFERRVEAHGEHWDDDVYIYPNTDWYDLGYQLIHDCYGTEIPDFLDSYIDYERYGKELRYDGYYQYSNGIIEIR